jgi:tetratricopeptide (TPR) repeat protein
VPCLHGLIMVCLVDVRSTTYTISRPVRLLFRRKHGFGEDALLTAFAEALAEYWGEADRQGTIRGSLIDTMIFMYLLEGKSLPQQFRRLLLPGTLLEVARELYNDAMSSQAEPEAFDRILALGPVAEDISMEDSTREAILGLLVRACVRTRRYAEAEAWLETFDRRGYRSVYSLRGFLHRLRGEYAAAIPWYAKALEARIHDLAILHELCICLHRLGRITEIKERLRQAGERTLENVYLLDMRIQIAIGEAQFGEAEELIGILRRNPDERERSYRREAVLVMRRDGDFARAVRILDTSIERLGGAAVEHRSSRAIANAYLKRFADAKRDIETIRRSRHPRAEEIALRLEAHVGLASGDWKTALNTIARFDNKAEPDHLLEADALEQKGNDVRVPMAERQAARERAIVIRSSHRSSSKYDIA